MKEEARPDWQAPRTAASAERLQEKLRTHLVEECQAHAPAVTVAAGGDELVVYVHGRLPGGVEFPESFDGFAVRVVRMGPIRTA